MRNPPNPVANVAFWVGFIIFGVVGLPLDFISWPLTALFFPDDKEEPSREFYWFSALSPTVFTAR